MRIISVANQKGGTAKTSTAHALATGATHLGKKSLAIDLDPQGNLTYLMGANPDMPGSYEILKREAPISEAIQHTEQGDVISACLNLANADTELSGKPGKDFFLKTALETIGDSYDIIVIDTPPALGTLLINALTASNEVVIPVSADALSLQGLFQLNETIKQVQYYYNKSLAVSGILLTKYSGRTILARDLKETIAETCNELQIPMYESVIREGIAAREAQAMRESLFDYAKKSNPAQDYLAWFKEINL